MGSDTGNNKKNNVQRNSVTAFDKLLISLINDNLDKIAVFALVAIAVLIRIKLA